MERIKNINPGRIAWCAGQIGISAEELPGELKIAQATLDRLFDGKGGLTFNQLKKVADYFGRSVFFFLEEGEVREELANSVQFRALANQKPEISQKVRKIIRQAEEQRSRYLALLEELGINDFPGFNPPNVAGMDAEDAAIAAREWLQIEEENTFEAYRTNFEAAGILVFRSNGYNGQWQIPRESKVLGFSLYEDICPVIFVRKQAAEARQTFTLAHELGHLLMHRTSAIDDGYDFEANEGLEQEANQFAGAFLVSSEVLEILEYGAKPTEPSEYEDWVSPVRLRTGASSEVVLRRLLILDRIALSEYRAYRRWKGEQQIDESPGGNRGYRHREPRHLFGDRFVKTVLDGLRARTIPLTKASRYLDNLKLHDIHALEDYYAGL